MSIWIRYGVSMTASSKKPWVYWDTSLIISFLTGADVEKMRRVESLLKEVGHRPSPYGVVFSQYIRAELRNYARDNPNHRKVIEEVFLALKPTADAIRWYPVDRVIGASAADIGSRFPSLSPADAVHVATALHAGAVRLWTYDGITRPGSRRSGKLAAFDGTIDGLRISAPDSSQLLPLWADEPVASTPDQPSSNSE